MKTTKITEIFLPKQAIGKLAIGQVPVYYQILGQ
jgi:hypothetical protein